VRDGDWLLVEFSVPVALLGSLCVFVGGDLVADRHVKAAFDSPMPDFANLWINNDPLLERIKSLLVLWRGSVSLDVTDPSHDIYYIISLLCNYNAGRKIDLIWASVHN
jgi:hypothetical protein